MTTISVATEHKRQLIDITEKVEALLRGDGLAHVFVRHTTAALTTADLDLGTDLDTIDALEAMTPRMQWRHPHDPEHFPDHLWAQIIGPSLSVPYIDGKLHLGVWQRLVLVELDGANTREVVVSVT